MSSSTSSSGSRPSSGPVSASSTTSDRLRSMKGQLAVRVIDEMYDDPFWMERFAARGRRHSEEDIAFHVDYLVQAIIARDPGVLERYARWLQSVLTSRGMCSLHLDESFERLEQAINESLGSDFCGSFFVAARRALFYDAATATATATAIAAREVQNAGPHLVASMISKSPTARARDLEHHVSYLADAIALDRPALFQNYIAFSKTFFDRHREGGAAHAEQTFEALRAAVASESSLSEETRAAATRILTSSPSPPA